MLATYPQTTAHPSQHQQPLHYADVPAPPTSSLPLYYTSALASPHAFAAAPALQQYRLPDVDAFGRPRSMAPTTLSQAPVRVQRTSATPQPHGVADGDASALAWQSYDDAMSAGHDRKTHQRIPSGSSVGSAGPASPFSSTASHPYIASDSSLSPSGVDSAYYDGLHPGEQRQSLDMAMKPLLTRGANDSFLAPAFQNYNPTQDPESSMEARVAMMQALREQQATADEGSPAPGLATPGRPQSSVGHRSPATPKAPIDEVDDARKGMPSSEYPSLRVLSDRR